MNTTATFSTSALGQLQETQTELAKTIAANVDSIYALDSLEGLVFFLNFDSSAAPQIRKILSKRITQHKGVHISCLSPSF